MTNKKSLNKANGPNSAFAFAEEPKENQMIEVETLLVMG